MELLEAELLANVSHELRSPLTSIKGYAATLLRHERRISREERHEFLLAIHEASDRLARVIDRLLEMSQLETGALNLTYTTVELTHLIREALTAIEQRVGQAEQSAAFTLRLEDRNAHPDELLIQADRYLLREVLDNLLENALRFSPEGGTIEVVVRPTTLQAQLCKLPVPPSPDEDPYTMAKPDVQEEQPMVEMSVHDCGVGIPSEHLARIFERFHRVDTRLTREVNGLGLGLAICKCIVELHNGIIWAESELGKGSTFHVLLPLGEREQTLEDK